MSIICGLIFNFFVFSLPNGIEVLLEGYLSANRDKTISNEDQYFLPSFCIDKDVFP